MGMRCTGFSADTYAFFALDLLHGPEREELAEHLAAACETCSAEITRSRSLWYSVGQATEPVELPPGLRRKVLNSVVPPQAVAWWQWRPWPVLAAAGMVVLAFSAGMFTGKSALNSPLRISFAPVYPAVPLSNRPLEAGRLVAAPAVPSPVQSVADPAQGLAINALNRDLAAERAKNQQLAEELLQQNKLLAGSRDSAAEAERSYRAAVGGNADAAEIRRQLLAASARASDLERQVTQYRVLAEAQRRRLDQAVQMAGMISDPSLRVLRLRATEKSQDIEGHAAITAGSQMVFYASHLPALPANRTYQLWVMRQNGAAVTSAGVFGPDASGKVVLQLHDTALLSGVMALAVTDEPSGGSPKPTGHKWMIGS